jgi:diguanylate cyclase (GGDEF)-like protein/PAS domain S-box-containing protein
MKKEPWYAAESKLRCKRLGMDPAVPPSFSARISEEELAKRRSKHEEILSVVDVFVNRMFEQTKEIPLLIVITDNTGCILEVTGDEMIKSTMMKLGINVGLQFKEEDAGTNGVTLALQHRQPIQIIGDEHYHNFLHESACYTVPFQCPDSEEMLGTLTVMTAVTEHTPFLLSMLCTVTDAIERELLLRKKNRRLHLLNQIMVEATTNGIIVTDKEGFITEYNKFAQKITGWKREQILGNSVQNLQPFGHYIKCLLQTGERFEDIELVFKNRETQNDVVCLLDVHPIYDKKSKLVGAFCQFRDITERYKAKERMDYMAHHDDLTELPNRRFFVKKLNERLKLAQESKETFSIMFLDLDRFKLINDTLGHNTGDLVLGIVAKRLKTCLSEQDIVARMGGDEFTILLQETVCMEEAERIAGKIIEELRKPLFINGNEFYLTASIGIVFYPHDGKNAEILMKHADIAMYQAKERGKNSYVVYKPSQDNGMEQLILESSLRKAIGNNEFIVYYQPQIDLRTERIVGVEALIRWKHPQLGMVSPAKFIPLAEETGMITQIGEWVMKEACRQNKKWQDMGLPPVRVSVNLSTRQFSKQDITRVVTDVLQETGLNPGYLGLEITESMTMNVEHAVHTLRDLKNLGVQISMDDFGTGYSSLYYLKKFSIDHLKIDQSFVRDIMIDSSDADIVSTIISMAHNLGIKVIAEGVETEEQLCYLKEQGCEEVQGYLYSPPLPAHEIESLLRGAKLKKTI